MRLLDLSPRGWGRVIFGTLAGTLGCIAFVLFVDSFQFPHLSEAELIRALLMDTLLPTVLAAPVLALLLMRLRRSAIAEERLRRLAATDSLTTLMNRCAFVAETEDRLRAMSSRPDGSFGVLFVIDVDHFKLVNDTFGHAQGDEALRIIARTIRSALRPGDCAGRIGGEEFAVFATGTTPMLAETMGERLRTRIADAEFNPDGKRHLLSVSIGAAQTDRRQRFADLFKVADHQLYAAKKQGRNRVAVSPPHTPGALDAAA